MKLLLLLSLLLITVKTYSQPLMWRALPSAPENFIKLDDCYFTNESTGWVISSIIHPGEVYKTTNGGYNWEMQYTTQSGFRCIGFGDSLSGWIGSLTVNKVLYHTTDGGTSWAQVTNLPDSVPRGICGIFTFDRSTMYACGRYDGPAHFLKTTDGGASWTIKDLSPLATSIVDIHFLNKDSGFVTGGIGLPIIGNSRAVVLFTSDAGNTWVSRYEGKHESEWGWKFSFLNKDTGIAAVESYRFEDSVAYLKTTDRGATWSEHRFQIDTNIFHAEGIFFQDANTMLIGGYYRGQTGPTTSAPTYMTTNGGINWQPEYWGTNLNRFRRVNDSVAYGSGNTVYKYSKDSTVKIHIISAEIPSEFALHQNYPNPFNPHTILGFRIPNFGLVTLKVYDIQGKEIRIVNEYLQPGDYEYTFDGSALPGGVYFYQVEAGKFKAVRKMVLVK
jgi:photosystem II stability/assembly factor-like uncharacterized protein